MSFCSRRIEKFLLVAPGRLRTYQPRDRIVLVPTLILLISIISSVAGRQQRVEGLFASEMKHQSKVVASVKDHDGAGNEGGLVIEAGQERQLVAISVARFNTRLELFSEPRRSGQGLLGFRRRVGGGKGAGAAIHRCNYFGEAYYFAGACEDLSVNVDLGVKLRDFIVNSVYGFSSLLTVNSVEEASILLPITLPTHYQLECPLQLLAATNNTAQVLVVSITDVFRRVS